MQRQNPPEPAPGEWHFGRPMEQQTLELPFPLTWEGSEASLPQVRGMRRVPRAHSSAFGSGAGTGRMPPLYALNGA